MICILTVKANHFDGSIVSQLNLLVTLLIGYLSILDYQILAFEYLKM